MQYDKFLGYYTKHMYYRFLEKFANNPENFQE